MKKKISLNPLTSNFTDSTKMNFPQVINLNVKNKSIKQTKITPSISRVFLKRTKGTKRKKR